MPRVFNRERQCWSTAGSPSVGHRVENIPQCGQLSLACVCSRSNALVRQCTLNKASELCLKGNPMPHLPRLANHPTSAARCVNSHSSSQWPRRWRRYRRPLGGMVAQQMAQDMSRILAVRWLKWGNEIRCGSRRCNIARGAGRAPQRRHGAPLSTHRYEQDHRLS